MQQTPAVARRDAAEWDFTARTTIRPPLPVDLRLTLAPLSRGHADPTMRRVGGSQWWRATRTPLGPAAMRIVGRRGEIDVEAWGPGTPWVLETAPDLVGARDSLEGFSPGRGLIRDIHRRLPGLRITRSRAVFEALVPSILEQKVQGAAARRSYRDLVRAWNAMAPGPLGLLLPPSPHRLARTPYFEFHRFGVERRRAVAITSAASAAPRIDALAAAPPSDAARRLTSLRGVGVWTAAEVAIVALGDADAVSVGDYHLPHMVAWALTGEPRSTDERMLELLEPYRGHRGRVLRLLTAAGFAEPRFGPRTAFRSFRRS